MQLQRDRATTDHNPGLSVLVRREPTVAERALGYCLTFIDTKKITKPVVYNVPAMEGAPWREYGNFDTYAERKQNDALTLLSLFLFAISQGNPVYQTAMDILNVTEWALKDWTRGNPEWKADYDQARLDGKKSRRVSLKERVEDSLEASAPFAAFKDLTRLYEVMLRNEEAQADRKLKKTQGGQHQLGSGPTINFLFPPGTTPEDIAGLTERIIEVQAREVPIEDTQPALPPPAEWDEDFDDEDE
jgi:hypothetical protein